MEEVSEPEEFSEAGGFPEPKDAVDIAVVSDTGEFSATGGLPAGCAESVPPTVDAFFEVGSTFIP